MVSNKDSIQAAADLLGSAEALLICAGAGMGVDSGLPDFRGPEGFWKEYPEAKRLGLRFEELANPKWFHDDPELAWGFYGHRYHLYRRTEPHSGYGVLRKWASRMKAGAFVFTSNVDGHFQKAGFQDERCLECHGSLMFAQCLKPCCAASWPMSADTDLKVDPDTLRAKGELPLCISCGRTARPNVLMFDDDAWMDGRTAAQHVRFRLWLRGLARGKLAVVELGAGTAIPTVRHTAEQVAHAAGTPLIRINPREAGGPGGCISIEAGALEALRLVDDKLT